ncbi:small ribosomal subunit protein uS11m isoform X3 [Salmo salar]|uniref:Small ribosomal subunit protein uS11m n=1 Tax=Salmo salar TaxID=8030 RepID=A0A1S3PWY8_SALSA|nr:28S ribosomal protein S11, mitochondrial isoform X3 [Salmo salar]|eukprot:XP_014032197.1 PREDICTED: 28S ribosomal protein S11, mitochondrial isoform X2 [Salmo salar]
MYKLNVILSHSGRRACQQVAGSFNAGGSICGTSSLQRAVSSSAVRLQEEASVSATPGKISKEFSHLPPMPGQDSVLRWAGKKYEELPIAHIKATYNNTHVQVTDCEGQFMVRTSCGTEGFKNVKKSTPIAAQTAGISAAAATAVGVTFVRVLVKGLGPGRLSAIKGLTMGGLEVVSITDNTPVPHNGCRPRKARRI